MQISDNRFDIHRRRIINSYETTGSLRLLIKGFSFLFYWLSQISHWLVTLASFFGVFVPILARSGKGMWERRRRRPGLNSLLEAGSKLLLNFLLVFVLFSFVSLITSSFQSNSSIKRVVLLLHHPNQAVNTNS